jgi:hypothetical protein
LSIVYVHVSHSYKERSQFRSLQGYELIWVLQSNKTHECVKGQKYPCRFCHFFYLQIYMLHNIYYVELHRLLACVSIVTSHYVFVGLDDAIIMILFIFWNCHSVYCWHKTRLMWSYLNKLMSCFLKIGIKNARLSYICPS